MSGNSGGIRNLYVRFMVWLGAEPPEGYEQAAAKPPRPTEYTVQAGETIYAIARKIGVPYKLIAQANGIEDYNSVQAGQTLTIPPPDWQPESGPPAGSAPAPEAEETAAEAAPEAKVETGEEGAAAPEAGDLDRSADDEVTTSPATSAMADAAETVPSSGDDLDVGPPTEAEPTIPRQEPLPDFGDETMAAAPEPTKVKLPETEAGLDFRYEVQRGDTLNSIARRYGLTVKELVEANNIADPSRIFPGQKLVIPGYMAATTERMLQPTEIAAPAPPAVPSDDRFIYTVASGDTLNAIAKRYGLTVRELIEANRLEDPNKLRIGQKLVIPGIILPAEPPAETAQQPRTDPSTLVDSGFEPTGPETAVKAVYMSYFAAGHGDFRQRIFELLDNTELNAVVIDAKGDFGWITYPTQIPLAHEIGAARPTANDFGDLLAQFKARGAYTIARVVTFKDNPLAASRPELAVKSNNGAIWQDRDELGWVDPYLSPVWDYNIQVALEAAQLGFDEIQFDFVRFPTASQAGIPFFSQDVTKETRVAAVTGFLGTVRGQLNSLGVKIAADTFGYTCWRTDDTVIGQDIDRMGQYLDVLCPMLYPSTFGNGIPGYKFAIAHPYEVVYHSAVRAVDRLKPLGCAVRPWIQDFPDYRFDKRVYGRTEIQAQIKGCFDAGSSGFMVWDPRVRYTPQAYAPARELA